jgi:hypothetical protein
MSNEQNPTAVIPTDNLPILAVELAKLDKKAEKLGTPTITYRLGERKQVESQEQPGTYYETVEVFVTGEAPKLNGWAFLATLEHDENGTLIRRFPNPDLDGVDLTQYRTATPDNCDHCHYRRRRNDTYLVVNEQGDTKQVGSSCLKDFTGHKNPEAVARYLELLRDFFEGMGTQFGGEGRIVPRYDAYALLEEAVAEVETNGYVSRRQEEESYGAQQATGQIVKVAFFDRLRRPRDPHLPKITGSHVAKAQAIIEWVRSLTDKDLENDYIYNLYTILKGDTITDRQMGIAASAIVAYDRVQAREIERKASSRVNEFIGEVGERREFIFTVKQIFFNATDYGTQARHILLADTGHTLVWSSTTYELEQGKTYSSKFSIKKHYESKYGKQTYVTRPDKDGPVEIEEGV